MTDVVVAIPTAAIVSPRPVLYCNACGMPPEYCSYGPDFETHCVPWLKSEHPAIFKRLHGNRTAASAPPPPHGDGGDGEGGENYPAPPPPTVEPWTTRERLSAFYTEYMPEKLDGIDAILEKYAGKEDKLFHALVKKYGPEPEDPYYAADSDDSDEEEDNEVDHGDDVNVNVNDKMGNLDVGGGGDGDGGKKSKKLRRGAAAKKVNKVETRVVVQKISRNRKKAVTHVVGMDTVPNIKLKEASKMFSKKFAGSSSVKGTEIIVQGDHLEEVAEMIVNKFKVSRDAVFLDLDGEFVPLAGY